MRRKWVFFYFRVWTSEPWLQPSPQVFDNSDRSIRNVRKVEYRCPYIVLTNDSSNDTYQYYWDRIQNSLDVYCMFDMHIWEVNRWVEDPFVLCVVVNWLLKMYVLRLEILASEKSTKNGNNYVEKF